MDKNMLQSIQMGITVLTAGLSIAGAIVGGKLMDIKIMEAAEKAAK